MLNQVNLVGRVAQAVTSDCTSGNTSVANFVVATDGRKDSPAQFHNIKVFGKQAEACHEYLQIGQQVVLTGRLTYEKWTDGRYTNDAGESLKRVKAVVIAGNVRFGMKARSKQIEPVEKHDGAGCVQTVWPEDDRS